MHISIDEQIASQLISGTIAVAIMVGIGILLSILLKVVVSRRFAFTRLALILVLSPLCMINLLDRSSVSTLYLYGIVVIVLGMTIDGIAHLLHPEPEGKGGRKKKAPTIEPNADPIVWEKVE